MAQDFFNQSETERKMAAKQAIDDGFCGIVVSHNGTTYQWEVVGWCEKGYESSILEALDVAACKARNAVDELL